MPYVSWNFDHDTETQHIDITGVFDVTITEAEYQAAPELTDEQAYLALLRRKCLPFVFLALPGHDEPLRRPTT